MLVSIFTLSYIFDSRGNELISIPLKLRNPLSESLNTIQMIYKDIQIQFQYFTTSLDNVSQIIFFLGANLFKTEYIIFIKR